MIGNLQGQRTSKESIAKASQRRDDCRETGRAVGKLASLSRTESTSLPSFAFPHPQSPLYFTTPSIQIQVSQNLLTIIFDTYHHRQESLLPSVCLTTSIILPLLPSPFPRVLISELIILTGGLLVVLFTPLNIPMFATSEYHPILCTASSPFYTVQCTGTHCFNFLNPDHGHPFLVVQFTILPSIHSSSPCLHYPLHH